MKFERESLYLHIREGISEEEEGGKRGVKGGTSWYGLSASFSRGGAVLALFRQGTLQFHPLPFKARREGEREGGGGPRGWISRASESGSTPTDAVGRKKIVTKRKQACCSDPVALCFSLLLN